MVAIASGIALVVDERCEVGCFHSHASLRHIVRFVARGTGTCHATSRLELLEDLRNRVRVGVVSISREVNCERSTTDRLAC